MLIVVRGAGDIATGTIHKLHRAGFKVIALEVETPTAIRREVAFSEAIFEGVTIVEDIIARRVTNYEELKKALEFQEIPVIVDPDGEWIERLKPTVVIDAILAKRNLGTNREMADITIALGPGFVAGQDVDVVVETMRGHSLGTLIFSGKAKADTGVPGEIAGVSRERVIYSPAAGIFTEGARIGNLVKKGERIGYVGEEEVLATIDGVLRGIIRDGHYVKEGLKIADIDPRVETMDHSYTISDKARNIGGAVLEAVLYLLKRRFSTDGKRYIKKISWEN